MTFSKNTMRNFLQFFLLSFTLTSCDCLRVVEGQIVDKSTQHPIEGIVIYENQNPLVKIKTDSLGKFRLSNVSGALFRCPPMKIIIEGNDYKQKKVKIKSGENIKIEIENSKF